jgi:hypothetical protein
MMTKVADSFGRTHSSRPCHRLVNVRTGGDIDMLSYCKSRQGPSFQLMVNHDDAKREFEYAEKNSPSRLPTSTAGSS